MCRTSILLEALSLVWIAIAQNQVVVTHMCHFDRPVRSNPVSWVYPLSPPGGTDVAAHNDLRAILSSGAEVSTRGEAGFDKLTQRWQKYASPDFDVATAIDSEQDVVETVRKLCDSLLAEGHANPSTHADLNHR